MNIENPLEYGLGLARGMTMQDSEILRFYNGILAALGGELGRYTENVEHAKADLYPAIERLNKAGMLAHIGYRGAAEIKPAG